MGHLSEEFEALGYAEGFAEGFTEEFAKGFAEGQVKGWARVLTRLLEKRFGEMSANLRERIFASDPATLEAWFDRALVVCDLTCVFQSAEPPLAPSSRQSTSGSGSPACPTVSSGQALPLRLERERNDQKT
jgi:hypothetical protein